MSVESAENSLENLESSIQIDGMLSQEEKNAFQEHFQIECGDINAETSSIIQGFLTTDLLQNIDQFDVLQQRAIRNILEKNVGNQGETISKEVQKYFQIDIENNLEVTQIQEQLNSLGLNLNQFLEGLKTKIEQDLDFLSPEHKEKIQKSIGIKTLLLGEELNDLGLNEYNGQELLNQRWIVNGKIQDTYNFYTKELFPTLELQHKLNNGETIPTQYTTRGERQRGPSYMSRVNHSIREVSELMNAELDEDGNFDEGWFQTQRLLNSDHYGEMFSDMGIESSENVSLLSEEDQKIEGKAMLCYLAAVGLQCVPYVGAVLSLPANVRDIFSSQDTTLQTLQGSNLVSSQYRMEKGPFDRIAAVIGVVFTAVGFQALAKTGKIAKAVSKITGLEPTEVSSIFGEFTQSMGLSDEVGATLGNFLGLNHIDEAEDMIPEAANINRAPNSGTEELAGFERTIRHTSDSYIEAGGRSNEYGFVDSNGQLHINTQAFDSLPQANRSQVMREFIAHERAHQAIMNLPEGELRNIHEHFIRNGVFSVIQEAEKYGLHFREDIGPLDTTNEILAHMIGRMRVGKEVPDEFLKALTDAGIDDITSTFGVNTSRTDFINNGGVRNSENLAEAAMTSFSLGERVIITRSDGSKTIATIDRFPGEGKVKVTWNAGNGIIGEKTVDINSLQQAGDITPDLLEDIAQLDSGFLLVLNDGRTGYVKYKNGDNLTIEMTQVDGKVIDITMTQAQLIERSGDISDVVRYTPGEIQIPTFSNIDRAIMFIRNMREPGIQGSAFYTKGYLLGILEDIQAGNLARIQEITSSSGLRTKIWDSIPDIRKREYIVPHLWPQGIDSHLSQGSIGNCYFLAALRSIKSHPKAQEMLSRIIKLEHDGSYTVRFPGDAHQREIKITSDQIDEMQQAGGMQGSLGDMILERAYARLAREQQEGVVDGTYTGRTIIQPLNPGERGKMAIEGGWMIKTLNEIFGRFGQQYNIPAEQIGSFLNQINEENKSSLILSLGSKFPDGHTGGRVDNFRYAATDADGNTINIFFGHAYGIENIDTRNRRLLVVNPHSTQGERFWMTYEQVEQNFGRLQGIGVDMNELGSWFSTADWLGDDVLMQAAN